MLLQQEGHQELRGSGCCWGPTGATLTLLLAEPEGTGVFIAFFIALGAPTLQRLGPPKCKAAVGPSPPPHVPARAVELS